MLGFLSEELVWAIARERQEEMRNIRPHTEIRPDPERSTQERQRRDPVSIWLAGYLRADTGR